MKIDIVTLAIGYMSVVLVQEIIVEFRMQLTMQPNGDTVFVYDDSSPYLHVSLNIDKSIKLQGENMDTTIVNCWGSISSDYVKVTGFTFQDYGPTIVIDGFSNNVIENCVFNGSAAGVEINDGSENNVIRNCSFKSLEFVCLSIGRSNKNEISYCDFFNNNNYMMGIPAISISGSQGIILHHCNITRNLKGGVSVIASSVKFNFNNIFDNNDYGVFFGPLSYGDLKNNWWGSSEGPNITIGARFWRQYHLKTVDNGENVFFGAMTIIMELLNAIRLLPWLSEPVSDAGQHF